MKPIVSLLLVLACAMLATVTHAQSWTPVANVPNIGAYNPLLLTDGSVMIQDQDNSDWWKLTPDKTGNYANGTWTQLSSTPGYGPLYYASEVMPDGRVFTMGGEYNFGNSVWQNLGYIYDPLADQWTFLPAPNGWGGMGDTGSVTLPNGTILLADPLSSQCAIFDPVAGTFGMPFTNGKIDGNDEEGLTLLPNGKVLTVDTTPNSSEIFDPATLTWSFAGTTPALLVGQGEEIGPQVVRPDGTVICFGGGGHNCVYNSATGVWSVAPDFPVGPGGQLDCCDAPACLLPNGNVLVMTSPDFNNGVQFFEWDGTSMNPVPNTPNSPNEPAFVGNMLMLPNGQVLVTDQSSSIMLYNPTGGPNPSWEPTITNVAEVIAPGDTVQIFGTQFNGLSGCSAFGDDEQNYTNYPLIRITNNATGDVTFCREFNPSTMAICTGSQIVSTNFVVPKSIEPGPSTIQVVTNGIASEPYQIAIVPPVLVTLAPSTVIGSNSSIGTVTLKTPAPPSGTLVTLMSSSSSATVPASVSVPGNGTTATFTITTTPVVAAVPVIITASTAANVGQATLTIQPATLSSLSVSPVTVTGGAPSTGTLTLTGPAPVGGLAVSLTSTNQSAYCQATVTVPAGSASTTFTINTTPVATSTPVSITATQGTSSQTAQLTIMPAALVGIMLSPTSVLGGNTSTGTLTMNGVVATGGAVISLTSSSSSATLPSSVTVRAGATSVTFNVATTAVSASTQATITATQGTSPLSAVLTITPATVASLSVSPTSVMGGTAVTGAFTLTGPAGPNGAIVTLKSSSTFAVPPVSIAVLAGSTSASFSISTSPVSSMTSATISATLNGSSQPAVLTITPAPLQSISVSPTTVVGGNSSQGSVNLGGVAGPGGAIVSLRATAGCLVPSTVTVPPGSSGASFTIGTTGQATVVNATVTATLQGVSMSATLTITPSALAGFTIAPNPVSGGDTATGTVTLNGAAPPAGVTVALSSVNPNVTLPASVTVGSGATSVSFSIGTLAVSSAQTATITAESGSYFQSASLSLLPASLEGLTLFPTAIVGGSKGTVTGSLTLSGDVPAPGKTVALSSSDPSLASVPATVKVLAGTSTISFAVTHKKVTTTQTVTITATYGNTQQTATLTLNPFEVVSLSVSPTTVTGGTKTSGTVFLNAEPGAASGPISVKLSSNSKAVSVPATVTVAVGILNSLFTVTTSPVGTTTAGTVTATYGSTSGQATVTVQPATLVSVAVSPSSVKGSAKTLVTGLISLSGAAPSGGLVVTLSTSNPSAANTPATVTVPAGKTTVTFQVTHLKVAAQTPVTIKAKLGSVISSAVLTVTP